MTEPVSPWSDDPAEYRRQLAAKARSYGSSPGNRLSECSMDVRDTLQRAALLIDRDADRLETKKKAKKERKYLLVRL